MGAGGVARAITTVLASRSPRRLYICNRTREKAERLCEQLNEAFEPVCIPLSFDDDIPKCIADSRIVINATNVGMAPLAGETLIPASFLRPDQLVADVIYNPEKTRFLREAEQLGCPTINGKSLLYHQGKIAFKIWTGEEAPAQVMKKAVYG